MVLWHDADGGPNGAYRNSGAGSKLNPAEKAAIATASGSKPGDLVLIAADDDRMQVNAALGELRHELGLRLKLGNPNELAFLWVIDFPLVVAVKINVVLADVNVAPESATHLPPTECVCVPAPVNIASGFKRTVTQQKGLHRSPFDFLKHSLNIWNYPWIKRKTYQPAA